MKNPRVKPCGPSRKRGYRLHFLPIPGFTVLLLMAGGFFRTSEARDLPSGNSAAPLQNVILIGMDSVRADHLSLFGYPRLTTPVLQEFTEKTGAYVFRRMTAVAPSCHPSHTTILSGLYPQQTGVPWCGEDLIYKHSDGEDEEDLEELEDLQEDWENQPSKLKQKKKSAVMNFLRIPNDLETLATFLQEKDFRTGGFIGIWTVTRKFGYDRGFDVYEDKMPDYYGPKVLAPILKYGFGSQRRQRVADSVDAALEFLEQTPQDQPFFLFLQLAQTHVPYSAPPEIDFRDETDSERIELEESWARRYPPENLERAMKMMKKGKKGFLLEEYDRSIKHTDSQIGRILEYLEGTERSRDTLVVLTADHGDSMGQHRYLSRKKQNRLFFEHSVYLWEETQHIPLVIFDPAIRGQVIWRDINASQVDLVPTILSRLGFNPGSFGTSALPGVDLLNSNDAPRNVYFLTFGRGRPGLLQKGGLNYPTFIGFHRGDTKFFVDQKQFKNPSKGRCFLFDLAEDPNELRNLCESGEESVELRTRQYRSRLVDWYSTSVAERFKKKIAETDTR